MFGDLPAGSKDRHHHNGRQTWRDQLGHSAYNLAEVTRAIKVAKALRTRGVEIRFYTHGETHEAQRQCIGFLFGLNSSFCSLSLW